MRLKLAAGALALALPLPAAASPLCDFTNQLIHSEPNTNRAIDGKAAGWVRCEARRSTYLCVGPTGSPQTTRLAHLLSINADLADCTGVTGEDSPAKDGQRDFRMAHGITVSTYIEAGGIHMRIVFAHPA